MKETPLDRAPRLGSRSSRLALARAETALDLLRRAGVAALVLHPVSPDGAQRTWSGVAALRRALMDGECEVAVHSAKDLPWAPVKGLRLAACLPRFDPREALIARDGMRLADLPPGARVGMGSPRRRGQVLALRPDVVVVEARGNVPARIARVDAGELDAIVVTLDGLDHLGLRDRVTEVFERDVIMPAPGQAAVLLECRTLDTPSAIVAAMAAIDDVPTHLAVTAERSLAGHLPNASDVGIGAFGWWDTSGETPELVLEALVIRPDGSRTVRATLRQAVGPWDTPADLSAALKVATLLGEATAAHLVAEGGVEVFHPEHVHAVPRVLYPITDDLLGPAIVAAGGDPVPVDLIRHVHATPEALDDVVRVLRQADQIGIASVETVRVLADHAEAHGMTFAELVEGKTIVAIGSPACGALVAESVTVDLLPSGESGIAGLLDAWPPPPADVEQPRAALPGSAQITPRLAQGLREHGWDVDVLPVYDTVTAERTPAHDAVVADGWPDVVIVVSATTARAVIDLFGMPPADVRVVAVGQLAARDAQALGLVVDVVVPSPKPTAVAAAALKDLVPAVD